MMKSKQMDHTAYPRIAKRKSSDALRWIIKDCQRTIEAFPDSPNAGFYADEISYCAMELKRRAAE